MLTELVMLAMLGKGLFPMFTQLAMLAGGAVNTTELWSHTLWNSLLAIAVAKGF